MNNKTKAMKKTTVALLLHLAIIFVPLVTIAQRCNISNLPSIQFKGGRATLSKDAMTFLLSASAQIKAKPDCRVRVIGHGASDKRTQQLSWDRVNTVIRYLVERQGISEDRFIFSFGEEGDPDSVDLVGTIETGPTSVPAPHPNLRPITLNDLATKSEKSAKKMASSKLKPKKK
jgi:hypothetical protein